MQYVRHFLVIRTMHEKFRQKGHISSSFFSFLQKGEGYQAGRHWVNSGRTLNAGWVTLWFSWGRGGGP